MVSGLAGRSGVEVGAVSFATARDARIDAIADAVEDHLDVDAVLHLVEHGSPPDLPPVRGGLVT
jgi:adenosylcobyric acid synthase